MPETRHFCPHCEETVSLSTIHRHKQLYYDERTHSWTKSTQVVSDSSSEDNEHEVVGVNYIPLESSGGELTMQDTGLTTNS